MASALSPPVTPERSEALFWPRRSCDRSRRSTPRHFLGLGALATGHAGALRGTFLASTLSPPVTPEHSEALFWPRRSRHRSRRSTPRHFLGLGALATGHAGAFRGTFLASALSPPVPSGRSEALLGSRRSRHRSRRRLLLMHRQAILDFLDRLGQRLVDASVAEADVLEQQADRLADRRVSRSDRARMAVFG